MPDHHFALSILDESIRIQEERIKRKEREYKNIDLTKADEMLMVKAQNDAKLIATSRRIASELKLSMSVLKGKHGG